MAMKPTSCIAVALLLGAALAHGQKIEGCPVFPANNIWNHAIDDLPKAKNSQQLIKTMGANLPAHADWGRNPEDGIPFIVVPGTQPKVKVGFESDESDPGDYPIPPNAPIEGGAASTGDRHILVIDRDHCKLYEVFEVHPNRDGSWRAGSGAIFDLRSNALREDGWTSADAAGLPIFPGLVRYDEAASGEIRHALRFTVPKTTRAYLWPARHFASRLDDPQYPPMGLRVRLRADFPLEGFSPEIQVILRALKKYGAMLADNGSAWFITGAPDPRWNRDHLRELNRVHGSDFEVVDVQKLQVKPDSAEAR
jgi:hypothetical protein